MFERLTTKNIGDRGEALAARDLKKHGYRILAKNFRSAHSAHTSILSSSSCNSIC